ncbi:uncharacterized protein CC84DRAFT_870162 [Paraphaeosphaeria sporulosa]|uniref:Uncharacterized protein n=1 Tax=Paraphaeosphaeria sporulosa TaxID=1460663 RepID=A0A177C8Z9_9PLEO|nr:uncharacterized protein CC84DRAFT_870162 [Paraphaeosphaeria sporulosa]OAG03856.1 hypothetical protein CC84DRAFT_870162 [Paraphaeosphaeria sporulosa]
MRPQQPFQIETSRLQPSGTFRRIYRHSPLRATVEEQLHDLDLRQNSSLVPHQLRHAHKVPHSSSLGRNGLETTAFLHITIPFPRIVDSEDLTSSARVRFIMFVPQISVRCCFVDLLVGLYRCADRNKFARQQRFELRSNRTHAMHLILVSKGCFGVALGTGAVFSGPRFHLHWALVRRP